MKNAKYERIKRLLEKRNIRYLDGFFAKDFDYQFIADILQALKVKLNILEVLYV